MLAPMNLPIPFGAALAASAALAAPAQAGGLPNPCAKAAPDVQLTLPSAWKASVESTSGTGYGSPPCCGYVVDVQVGAAQAIIIRAAYAGPAGGPLGLSPGPNVPVPVSPAVCGGY